MKKALTITILIIAALYEGYRGLGPTETITTDVDQKRISIMTYNVENLFDTIDDPGKNDETFLPKKKKDSKIRQKCKQSSKGHWVKECLNTNWTEYALALKMKRLASVIKGYKKNGPDILILQEVENLRVLSQFNEKHLGYPNVILLEGPDKRGIDTAILSKLESTMKPKIHLQHGGWGNKPKATRGILEANLKLPNNETISVFAIHFPSQGSPTKTRLEAIKRLNGLVQKTKNLSIAGGDFNITKKENDQHKLFSKDLNKYWSVSHLIGCKKCRGSNYYHRARSWSFLDAILFSKNFNTTWKIDKKSIDVFNDLDVQVNRHGSPKKFEMGKHQNGVSDHWPVVAEIYL